MTKADIVNEISRSTGIEKSAVLATVEKFMEVVKDNMASGENVYLRGFGSFIIKTRKEKTARNISQKHHYPYSGAQDSGVQAFARVPRPGKINRS